MKHLLDGSGYHLVGFTDNRPYDKKAQHKGISDQVLARTLSTAYSS